MKPILSIIIPSKNRYTTLLPLLDALCSFESDNFEIVIQDNSDNNSEILNYLKRYNDTRLKYFYCDEKLSVIDNSDLAVKNCIGEYVCFIGDDDGVMPYVIDVVEWMKKERIEVIRSYKPDYIWPGLKSSYLDSSESGVLKYQKFDYKINSVKTKDSIKTILARGGTEISTLPCLYHGIVSRILLDKVYDKTGSYFPGPSPDMANAVALCFFVDSYRYLNFPVVISGKSYKSTGGQGLLHNHVSRIEDVPHLPKSTNKKWNKKIPKFWTGPTIWAESVIKSLEACGHLEKIKQLNLSYLYAWLVVFNFAQRKQLFTGLKYNFFNFSFIYNVIKLFIYRVYIFFLNRTGLNGVKPHGNIKNIGDAITLLNATVIKDKLPF